MKTRIFVSALAVVSLWGCFSSDSPSPTSPDTIQELQLKGSISGTVTDSVKIGISGVAVTLDGAGFATNTDSLGRYTIPDVPGGTWTLRFTKSGWRDTARAGIVLAIDEDRPGVDISMGRLPDSSLRSLLGAVFLEAMGVPDTKNIRRIEAVATGTKGDTLARKVLDWYSSGNFTGDLPLKGKAGRLEVIVLDTNGHATSKGIAIFDTGSAAINIGNFYQYNAMPSVSFTGKLTSGDDSVSLHALATDKLDGRIVKLEWKVDGGKWVVGATDTSIPVPLPTPTSFEVQVRATDDDGNIATDTHVYYPRKGLVDVRDKQVYGMVTIGNQTWMAQNLNFETDSSWWYENSVDSGAKYGRLYTWAAAMALPDSCNAFICSDLVGTKHRGICPAGWHVPSDHEWLRLTDTLMNADSAGWKLKSTSGWAMDFYNGTDAYGFAALPAGMYVTGGFSQSGMIAAFWSSDAVLGYTRMIQPYLGSVGRNPVSNGSFGQSLRCLRD